MEISGSTVLLTGATGGLGQSIARALWHKGAQLTLTGRRVDVLQPLAKELDARAIAVDLSNREEVERLIGEAGAVDILVANAGLSAAGAVQDFSMEEIDRVLEVNLRAPTALAHGLLPAMLERRRGHILFMSSLAGKAATAGQAVYNATKFGLRGLALAMRADLHGTGVGVSAVFPGFIREAGMFAEAGVKLPPGVGTRAPQDVSKAVLDAIERDRAEVDVAPLQLRIGSLVSGLAPDLSATIARKMGGERIASAMADSQRDSV